MASVFQPAIDALVSSGRSWSDPVSFQKYVRQHGLQARSTAQCISIQSLEHLDPLLRRAGVMVFRLGTSVGDATTRFALARAPSTIEDFFLIDREIFTRPATRFAASDMTDLLPFRLLGDMVEAGALNLAIASGLLGQALGLDTPWPRTAPATGCSTYTFEVVPHRSHDVSWTHTGGQVEVDAILAAPRGGKLCLFVVEAKHGAPASLAKTKLTYAVAAVASRRVPADVAIIPVYFRSWQDASGLHCAIAECAYPDPRRGRAPVADLVVKATSEWVVAL